MLYTLNARGTLFSEDSYIMSSRLVSVPLSDDVSVGLQAVRQHISYTTISFDLLQRVRTPLACPAACAGQMFPTLVSVMM